MSDSPRRSAFAVPDPRPLALRLPRPPRPLVGRDRELARLHESLAAPGPVLVTGPSGAGKSLLALTALQTRENTLRVQGTTLIPGGLVAQLRRLLQLGPTLAPDWRLLDANPQEALAALIELADHGDWTLWLDDLDATADEELRPLLEGAAAWARTSRWLVTRRRAPAGLQGHMPELALGPLDEAAMRSLLPDPASPDADAILRAAAGRPGPLYALLPVGKSEDEELDNDALDDLRRTLRLLRRPVQARVLEGLGIPPDSPLLARLTARGEVRVLPEGLLWRNPEGDPPDAPEDASRAARIAACLVEEENDPDALLEALRLRLHCRDWPAAADLLRRFGDEICEAGRATELWILLDERSDGRHDCPPLQDWYDWSAWESGREPEAESASPRDGYRGRALEARRAIGRGDFDAAIAACIAAENHSTSPREIGRIRTRRARALFSMGRRDECTALLDETACEDAHSIVEAHILRAECAAVAGRSEDGASHVEALLELAPTLSPPLRLRAYLGIARVHLICEQLRDAERILHTLLRTQAERCGDSVSGRTALELAATVALLRGNLDELDRLLERITPRRARARAVFLESYRLCAGLWRWTPARYRKVLLRLAHEVASEASPMAAEISGFLEELQLRAAALGGHRESELPPLPRAASAPARPRPETEALRAAEAARWGRSASASGHGGGTRLRLIRAQAPLLKELHLALHASPADRGAILAEGRQSLLRTHELAQGEGYQLEEIELLRIGLFFAWADRAPEWGPDLRKRLRDVADAMGAARLLEELDWWDALGADGAPHPVQLEAWASDAESIATRRRWASWLLGESPPLDPLEQALLAQTAERPGWRRARTLHVAALPPSMRAHQSPTGPTGDSHFPAILGVDIDRAEVWSAGGATVPLRKSPLLLRLLQTLITEGGRASKETLVMQVWEVGEYHPLRHDNRLRLAARKLRRCFADAGLPDPLLTGEDGYALGGTWRIR